MRTLVVSDIHSNLVALEAVLADARERGGFQRVWCLGDIVGYGPEPMACLERLWDLDAVAIVGNHDAGAVGTIGLDEFNPLAAQACEWTSHRLSAEARDYLRGLPTTVTNGAITLVHGAPRDPIWEYLVSYSQAQAAWESIESRALLVGHSHIPFVCVEGEGMQRAMGERRATLAEGRLVANPGSVGQPRDGDSRAAYAVYDDADEALELRRTVYDIAATQRRMEELGLPGPLSARLSVGR